MNDSSGPHRTGRWEAILAADEVMRRARVIACSLEEKLIDKADVFRLIGTLRPDWPADVA